MAKINVNAVMRTAQFFSQAVIVFTLLTLTVFGKVYAQSHSKPELYVKTGHIAPVYSVAISPDSKLLASGGSDGNIKLCNLETGQEIRRRHSRKITPGNNKGRFEQVK